MKQFIQILSIVILIPSLHYAQNFFPLDIGYKWQYEVEEQLLGNYSYSYPKTIITEDTLINSLRFFKVDNSHYYYDQSNQKLYIACPDTIALAADFNFPEDSTIYVSCSGSEWTSLGQYYDNVFGEQKLHYKMKWFKDLSGPGYVHLRGGFVEYVEYLGVKKTHYWDFQDYGYEISYSRTKEICSAILDTLIHNPHHLSILLNPQPIDRPINEFPFVLGLLVNVTNPVFLNELFAEVYVFRNDTIQINHSIFNFNPLIFETTIELDSTILEVDDLIKIRAVASDTSLFNNVATDPDSGFYEFRVLPATVGVVTEDGVIYNYALYQNYPNPFNPVTTIKYQIPERGIITLKVYDILGNEVATLVNEEKPAGSYQVEFSAIGVTSSGVYYYRMRAGKFVDTKKLILLK